jgi:hypothetical protein
MESEATTNKENDVSNIPIVPPVPQLRDHLKDEEIMSIKHALDNIKSIEMYVIHDYILYGNTVCLVSLISWVYTWLILFNYVEMSIVSIWVCFMYLYYFYNLFQSSKVRMKSLSDFRSIVTNCFGEQNFINQLSEVEKDRKKQGENND